MQDSEYCPTLPVPDWVIFRYPEHQQHQVKSVEGLKNSSLTLRRRFPKEWATIRAADRGVEHRAEIHVIDLDMNQLYNRYSSREPWPAVPAVQ